MISTPNPDTSSARITTTSPNILKAQSITYKLCLHRVQQVTKRPLILNICKMPPNLNMSLPGAPSQAIHEAPPGSKAIDQILASARSHLARISPFTAYDELCASDISREEAHIRSIPPTPVFLIDIRPQRQREEFGEIKLRNCNDTIAHCSVIERNVLEWRLDPQNEARLPWVDDAGYDTRVIVMCQEGYTSSLAARSLQELGLHRATDMEGGYKAWKEAGLPNEVGDRKGPMTAH